MARVLATAFAADPVIRWLMPDPGRDVQMFRALASSVHAAPGCADMAWEAGEPVGAAVWDPPGHSVPLRQGLAGLWGLVVAMRSGFRRGIMLQRAFTRARPDGKFWYLAQIGAAKPQAKTWTATLTFQQVDQLTGKDRLANPGGLLVTDYQSTEDSAP